MQANKLSHAYLFVGPSQVGKTTLAKGFAQAIYCAGEDAPCGECRPCRLVQTDRHPDVCLVAPEKDRIKIETIRDLQHTISLAPVEGAYRVCIIRQIDLATPSAANSLLKTLEEPPSRVILVLTADRGESLLSTIVSRCQVLSLRLVPAEKIVAVLEARGVDDERAQLLGHLAQGRVGWALQASVDERVLSRRDQVLEKLQGLDKLQGQDKGAYQHRFVWAEQLSRDPERVPYVLDVLASWWRDVLVLASGSEVRITNVDCRSQLAEWAARYDVATAQRVLHSIQDTVWRLDRNANRRLALEVLMLDLPGVQ
jgi:DNA polymerase-3 subunit delta'